MKKHPIPQIDAKKWESIQDNLREINKSISNILENTKEKETKCLAEKICIHLGLLDVDLGREYPLRELYKELKHVKKEKKDKQNF